MPREVFGRDYVFLPRAEILTFEEMTRLARIFVRLGVTKIRLTGGEPLLRRDIEKLIAMLAAIDGLDDPGFMALNDASIPVRTVLDAIDNALAAGLAPVKVDMVVVRGVNDESIL